MHVIARRFALFTAFSTIVALFAFGGVASAAVVDARYIDLTPTSSVNLPGTAHVVTATVTDVDGLGVNGVEVTFTETGVGAITTVDTNLSLAGVQITTATVGLVDGVALVTTQTAVDQFGVEEITGTIDPAVTSCDVGDGYCTDTVTKTWQGLARFIDVSPDTATNAAGTVHVITATVTEANGVPVEGVLVDFSETGTGFFVFGFTPIGVETDENGVAQAYTTTFAGQEGDQEITAEMPDDGTTDCSEPIGIGVAAGNCDETVTKTWGPGVVSDCTITGTEGDDVLEGTEAADIICGLAGNDTITGLGGNDTLRGGAGNDTAKGGIDDDIVRGGAGNDALRGGPGNDTVKGGGGNDNLKGGSGNDALRGGKGTDTCKGGPGTDSIKGCEN